MRPDRPIIVVVAALGLACGRPQAPMIPEASGTPAATTSPAPPRGSAADPSAEPASPPPTDDEKLAAIQKAMNDLAPAAQTCWAAVAASERFDVEGELAAQIDIAGPTAPHTRAALVRDTARNSALASCLTALLEAYRWPPPLAGQSIQLPFRFRAPDGQSVIDRRLVPVRGQGSVAVAVLLDENTTGNGAASMLGVAIRAGGSTGLRAADRDELWYVTAGDATVAATGETAVHRGDVIFVPKGGARDVRADRGDVHAVLVLVPGGREGIARAGALPAREVASAKGAPMPIVLRAADAHVWCRGPTLSPAERGDSVALPCQGVQILAEPAATHSRALAASRIRVRDVPAHVHATETELVYVEAGRGTMTIGGTDVPITETSVIQVPPGIQHAVHAVEDLQGLQIYTPAGPEQRFKKSPP